MYTMKKLCVVHRLTTVVDSAFCAMYSFSGITADKAQNDLEMDFIYEQRITTQTFEPISSEYFCTHYYFFLHQENNFLTLGMR